MPLNAHWVHLAMIFLKSTLSKFIQCECKLGYSMAQVNNIQSTMHLNCFPVELDSMYDENEMKNL